MKCKILGIGEALGANVFLVRLAFSWSFASTSFKSQSYLPGLIQASGVQDVEEESMLTLDGVLLATGDGHAIAFESRRRLVALPERCDVMREPMVGVPVGPNDNLFK